MQTPSRARQFTSHFAAIALLFVVTVSHADSSDEQFTRKGKGELFATGMYLNGEGLEAGSGGVGLSAHINDYFALGLDGAVGGSEVDGENGLSYTFLANIEYNILKARFTPFLVASAGIVGFETYTGNFFLGSTEETERGAFGGGVGLRWNIGDHFLVRGSYRAMHITGGRHGGLGHLFEIGLGGMF